jgi:hypothetical protein
MHFTARVSLKRLPHGEYLAIGDGLAVGRTCRRRLLAHGRLYTVVLPRDFESIGVRLSLNTRRPDQPGQGPRRVGAPRESEDVNLVARGIVGNHEAVAFAYNLLETEADGAAEEPLEDVAFRVHAVVIMHTLRGAVRRLRLDEGIRGDPICAVQGRDVSVAGRAFLIPGPVDENHDSLHWPSPPLVKRPPPSLPPASAGVG